MVVCYFCRWIFDIVDMMKGHAGDGACVLGASGSMTQYKLGRLFVCPSYPLRLIVQVIGSRSSCVIGGLELLMM